MAPLARPGRNLEEHDRALWSHLRDGPLRLQHCSACAAWWYPPGPCCPTCRSTRFEWEPVAGRGEVVAWTTFHRAYLPQFPVPHTVVVAQLPEGPLLAADLCGDDPAASPLALGDPVELVYRAATFDDDGEDGMTFSWQRGGR